LGVQAVGLGLGTLLRELGARPEIVVGHDFRAYSEGVKLALVAGLTGAGMDVSDIGLALSPTAYFAQHALGVPCVAMVTASHNENGWTGVKMGAAPSSTFGPEEMGRLKQIVLAGAFSPAPGSHCFVEGMRERYLAELADRPRLSRRLKVVAACGNGTAGAFAPQGLEALGCEVIPLDAAPDWSFPRYEPNPEDLRMLAAMRAAVIEHGADLAFGFDGDGDRCGVVDDEGVAIFADKVGVLIARDLARAAGGAHFVVDVKSTGLFATDPEILAAGGEAHYWKTGHSHMKRRSAELGAVAGFERSGHYFFNAPLGRGYDDALLAAFAVCDLLDRRPGTSLSDLRRSLPPVWSSPTMSPRCDDSVKRAVVEDVSALLQAMQSRGEPLAGRRIREVLTVDGARVTLDDGTWGLVRASSNKPELSIVIESPVSEARMREMFGALDALLRRRGEVGPYNQSI
jgi:phosphomannomutase/phosphoglucomutase